MYKDQQGNQQCVVAAIVHTLDISQRHRVEGQLWISGKNPKFSPVQGQIAFRMSGIRLTVSGRAEYLTYLHK